MFKQGQPNHHSQLSLVHRQEGNSGISDRAFAWLLGVTLVLGALTNYSPFLHLVLRHGSLNLAEVHFHSKPQTSHPLQAPNQQQDGQQNVALPFSGSDANAPENDHDPSDHEHHGLPELLLAGMVDVATTDLPPLSSPATSFEPTFRSGSVIAVSSLDPVSAPRPPPYLTVLL